MCNDCPICIAPLFPASTNIMRLKKKVLVRRGERLPVTKLKCGHTFHSSCIKKWFMKTDVDASDRCPMCRDKIRFKKNSKDLMMHKLRWDDPEYRYGDEHLYEVDTDSDYSDGSSSAESGDSEWGDAWDEVVDVLIQDTGHEDLSVPLGENWADIVSAYLNGAIGQDGVWDRVDGGRDLRELIDSVRDDQEAWSRGEDAWEEAIRNIEQL